MTIAKIDRSLHVGRTDIEHLKDSVVEGTFDPVAEGTFDPIVGGTLDPGLALGYLSTMGQFAVAQSILEIAARFAGTVASPSWVLQRIVGWNLSTHSKKSPFRYLRRMNNLAIGIRGNKVAVRGMIEVLLPVSLFYHFERTIDWVCRLKQRRNCFDTNLDFDLL